MNSLQRPLTQLNRISNDILNELRSEKPSIETVQNALNKRKDYIEELRDLTESLDSKMLSTEEQMNLKLLFNEFSKLNKNIHQDLDTILDEQEEKLVDATNRRKAEDGYQVLKNPTFRIFN